MVEVEKNGLYPTYYLWGNIVDGEFIKNILQEIKKRL